MDIDHQFGSDLVVGATGDLRLVADASYTQQRVLKRLLTNQGAYLWHLGYGGGLPQFVGQPARDDQIRAVIRGQIFKEATVARTPEPQIDVSTDRQGGVYVDLRYTDVDTGQTQILTFAVSS